MGARSLAGWIAGRAGLWMATLALMGPLAAPATTLVQMTLEQTVAAADVVVRGTVVDRTSGTHRDGAGNEWVVTYIDVAVDHAYVGDHVPATVRYVIPGGTAPNGDIVSVPSGFPNEAVGAEVLLMIEKTPIADTYAVSGAAQGRYYVTESPSGATTASRMPVDAQLIDRATGAQAPAGGSGALMPLEQLEDKIAAAARQQGRAYNAPERQAEDDPPPHPEAIGCPDEEQDDDETSSTANAAPATTAEVTK